MNHRPVCVKCQTEMRPENNGVGLLDMANYSPSQIWAADLYKCPSCRQEIVVGFGVNAISYHTDENFDRTVNHYRNGPGLYINNS